MSLPGIGDKFRELKVLLHKPIHSTQTLIRLREDALSALKSLASYNCWKVLSFQRSFIRGTAAGEMLAKGDIDAFAPNKAILYQLAEGVPGSKVLSGQWGMEHFGAASRKAVRRACRSCAISPPRRRPTARSIKPSRAPACGAP
jgi:hypothetical protein